MFIGSDRPHGKAKFKQKPKQKYRNYGLISTDTKTETVLHYNFLFYKQVVQNHNL